MATSAKARSSKKSSGKKPSSKRSSSKTLDGKTLTSKRLARKEVARMKLASKKPSSRMTSSKKLASKIPYSRREMDPAMLKFTPSNSERASFLGIPPELRLHIYRYLCWTDKPARVSSLYVFSYLCHLFESPLAGESEPRFQNLLYVNRLIYQEFLAIFYSRVHLELNFQGSVDKTCHGAVELLSPLSPNWIPGQFLQRISLYIDVRQGSRRNEALRYVKRVAKASSSWKRLRHLDICFDGDSVRWSVYYSKILSKLKSMRLESLESVRCDIYGHHREPKDEACLQLERTLLSANDRYRED